MSKDFNLSDKTMQYVHNHAMHFVKQYLRIYSSRQKPLFQSCQNLVGQPVHQLLVKNAYFKTSNMSQPNNHERLLILLERTVLQSAVLGLVFKTHFQDYALEHVASALERFELFNDGSSDFKECYQRYLKMPRRELLKLNYQLNG